MNRKSLREFTHNAKGFLKISNAAYKQWVFRYTFLELEKDLTPFGDITTQALFKENFPVSAKIITRESGILAGLEEIKYFLMEADGSFKPRLKQEIKMDSGFFDGAEITENDTVLKLRGGIQDILAVERTILNLLMRMSGVATLTKKFIDLIENFDVLITPTRKTLWGLLDKKAVTLGGGGTHRLNLSDAILVKDTHLDPINRDFSSAMENLFNLNIDTRFIEFEVDNYSEALNLLRLFDEYIKKGFKFIGAILLDNMDPEIIGKLISVVKQREIYDKILFEASGGINETNIRKYAETGVDIISMGCLTNAARSLDMSMKLSN